MSESAKVCVARERDMGPSSPWHMDDTDEPESERERERVRLRPCVCERERESE